MKKFIAIMGCILAFILSATGCQAQILSPVAHLQGNLLEDSMLISLGKTSIVGTVHGQPLESLMDITSIKPLLEQPILQELLGESYDLDLLEDLHAIPLFGNASVPNVERLTIIDIEALQHLTSENISMENLTQLIQNINFFSNVDMYINEGISFLGIGEQGIHFDTAIPYAISTTLDLELIEGTPTPLFVVLSDDDISFTYEEGTSIFYSLSDATEVTIKNTSGEILFKEQASDKVFLLQEPSLSVIQQSALHAYPLSTNNQITRLSVSPADASSLDLPNLLEQLSKLAASENSMTIPDISSFTENVEPLLSVSAQVLNGAMVLVGSQDTLTIDHTLQEVNNIGLGRADTFDIIVQGGNPPQRTIEGNYKLVFLGDHLYTLQAPNSEQGVALPLFIIAVWVISLGLYLFLRIDPLKKKGNGTKWDTQVLKKYGLLIHVAALILVFILMDREISYQFGISALDVLFGQGASVILGVILLVELIMWVVGFIAVAFPLRMIINSIISYMGIEKEGKVIGKSLGALGIWIFSALYVKLMVNVILLFLQPGLLFPLG